jgi:hypothetical protein
VAFNDVGHLAHDVGALWDLVRADCVSVNWTSDPVLAAFQSPMSLDVIVEVLLLAVAGEAVRPTGRANDYIAI